MSDVKKVCKKWNKNEKLFDLFQKVKLYQFVRIDTLQTLDLNSSSIIMLYKFNNPIIGVKVSVKFSQNLSVGKMYSLYSLTNNFGYMFEFPNVNHHQGPGFFGISRRSLPMHDDVKLTLKSEYLYVFESTVATLLIGKMRQNFVERFTSKNGK